MSKVKVTEVRKAHDLFAETEARYGENNMETIRKLAAYQDLRARYESESGKTYKR
jgi:hypothetical protein